MLKSFLVFLIALNLSLEFDEENLKCGIKVENNELKNVYPWMTSLFNKNVSLSNYLCRGVLISRKRILTAARCVHNQRLNLRKIVILFGAYNSFASNQMTTIPSNIYVHPDYNPYLKNHNGDLSILEINVEFSIIPVCLWTVDDDMMEDNGVKIIYSMENSEMIPKEIKVSIIDDEKCLTSEKNTTFCGQSDEKDFDDSGNGLFIIRQGIYHLRGISSKSYLNGSSKLTIYSNIQKYKNFIDNPTVPFLSFKNRSPYQTEDCGMMDQSSELIIGGRLSNRKQFPWIAIISLKINAKWMFTGTGSLITSKHVISRTIAVLDYPNFYKNIPKNRIKIFLGATLYNDLNKASLKVGVFKIVNHPGVRISSRPPDLYQISLIYLDRYVELTDFIRPVCLWPSNYDDWNELNNFIGKSTYAVGYGHNELGKNSLIRKHIQMTITDNQTCSNIFDFLINATTLINESKLFCVRGNGKDGPLYNDDELYIKIGPRWYLRGKLIIVSVNLNLSSPILCENIITSYLPWIQNQISYDW